MVSLTAPRIQNVESAAPQTLSHDDTALTDQIAVVVLTHNRVHLLQKCVENVLLKTSTATREIVIWDNASTDGTADYLQSLVDPRIRVVASEKNIGQNGYARAFKLTTAPYFIELDDDVVDAPPEWDRTMLQAFLRLPDVGFLAADLEDDPHDLASRYRHHIRPHEYTLVEENGVRLLRGPAGGGCAMTSRELNRTGGWIPRGQEAGLLARRRGVHRRHRSAGIPLGGSGRLESASHRWPALFRHAEGEGRVLEALPATTRQEDCGQADAVPHSVLRAAERTFSLVCRTVLSMFDQVMQADPALSALEV